MLVSECLNHGINVTYHVTVVKIFLDGAFYQTRHTFATLILDAGEHPGWVQTMMGHETLQMIYEKYYSYIKNYERDEGSAFMEKVFNPSKAPQNGALSNPSAPEFTPAFTPNTNGEPEPISNSPLSQ
jgi:hypothetical protein